MHTNSKIGAIVVTSLVVLSLAGCASASSLKTTPPTTKPVTAVGAPAVKAKLDMNGHTVVTITDEGFEPPLAQLKAGGTVVWRNETKKIHKVQFASGPQSKGIAASQNASHVFKKAGVYTYSDPLNPAFKGSIIVK